MTFELFDDYNNNRQLEESEICYKNNRGKEHDYESVNTVHISRNVIETEYICCLCGNLKYFYSYLEDST